MRSAVTVSLVPQARGGPFVFWDGLADACARAGALGFDAVEIFAPGPDAVDPAELRALLARHALRVAAFGTGGGWVIRKLTLTHADAAIRREGREFIRGMIDMAAGFGAPAIVGSMQGRWEGTVTRPQALDWLGEALDDLGEHAAGRGVPLFFEPINRYETNLLTRVDETAAWIRTLKTRNVRILADLFHMNIEDTDIAATLRAAGAAIGHIHFVDSNRRAIGFGHTDATPILAALREIGYTGYLSAEAVPLPDSDAAARQAIAAFRQCMAAR